MKTNFKFFALFALSVLLLGLAPSGGPFFPSGASAIAATNGVKADAIILPNKPGSLKFAVIGDTGTGGDAQRRIAEAMNLYCDQFPFTFALMMGDNMYGSERPSDFRKKFEEPYRALLDRGVKFYATLGNHDDPNERSYSLFNMGGERFHSFKPSKSVRVFVLDSSYMDPKQVDWLSKELKSTDSPWKIAMFHHPLYSSAGAHGSDLELRKTLEPLFVENGVDVVLAGHDHVYERIKPQKGITYFVVGNSAKLRKGNLERSGITAAGYDQGYAFMLVEIDGDEFHFQVFSDKYKTIDQGVIRERDAKVK